MTLSLLARSGKRRAQNLSASSRDSWQTLSSDWGGHFVNQSRSLTALPFLWRNWTFPTWLCCCGWQKTWFFSSQWELVPYIYTNCIQTSKEESSLHGRVFLHKEDFSWEFFPVSPTDNTKWYRLSPTIHNSARSCPTDHASTVRTNSIEAIQIELPWLNWLNWLNFDLSQLEKLPTI